MGAALVPELYVSDLGRSIVFYRALGFHVAYDRPSERFACIKREGAELMLEEPVGRVWLAGPLQHPHGIGVNFQISVSDAAALHAACRDMGLPFLCDLEDKTYMRDADPVRVRQFVVQDPDGYLLRFSQAL